MFTIQPITFYTVNDFIPVVSWSVANDAPVTLHFILQKQDAMGTRRVLLTPGSTVSLAFVQARPASSGSVAVTMTKVGQPVAGDGSMFYINLTADETKTITSGGVQLVVVTNGATTKTNIPYMIKKSYSSPGF